MERYGTHALPVGIFAGLIIIWESVVRLAHIPLYVLPSPTEMLKALYEEAGTLAVHSCVTVFEALAGMGIALIMAVLLGIAMDGFGAVKRGLYPLLVVTQTVPMIVLAPILIIYLGFGMTPKILTVVLMCFFPIVVSFTDGMAHLDQDYINLVRSYGAGRWKVYRLVKIPAALPALISGLKVSATYSISGAVVGEWIGSQSGLGYYLLRVKNGYMLDRVFACVFVIILLSLMMNGLIRVIQSVSMPYNRAGKGGK
ncbi:ABC transporter permease [Lachnospiraceae bacterium 62-35]